MIAALITFVVAHAGWLAAAALAVGTYFGGRVHEKAASGDKVQAAQTMASSASAYAASLQNELADVKATSAASAAAAKIPDASLDDELKKRGLEQ